MLDTNPLTSESILQFIFSSFEENDYIIDKFVTLNTNSNFYDATMPLVSLLQFLNNPTAWGSPIFFLK